jgi:hypothetical protein
MSDFGTSDSDYRTHTETAKRFLEASRAHLADDPKEILAAAQVHATLALAAAIRAADNTNWGRDDG